MEMLIGWGLLLLVALGLILLLRWAGPPGAARPSCGVHGDPKAGEPGSGCH